MKGSSSGMDSIQDAVVRFFTPRRTPTSPRERRLLEEGRSLTLISGLRVTAWGAGPLILLIHGWEGRRGHWKAFISALVEAGFCAVAADGPAHGESPGQQLHVVQYCQSILDISAEVGPFAAVIAHSFGGVATMLALHRGFPTQRAVIIASPSSLRCALWRRAGNWRVSAADLSRVMKCVEDVIGESLENLDAQITARDLNQSALIIHDREDDEVPLGDGLAIAASWAGARMLVTKRFGHRRILAAKPVIQEVIHFLVEPETDEAPRTIV